MTSAGGTASPEVVTLGETMVLLVAEQPGPLREATTFRRSIGGAESNVAIGLCRLGRSAAWVSRVGADDFGRVVLNRIRSEGVDTSRVIVDPEAATGLMIRESREAGPVNVSYYRRDSAASRLTPADLDDAFIAAARFLLVSGITPALSTSAREATFAAVEIAREAGVKVVFDPNLRRKLWPEDEARRVMLDLLSHCDIAMPGLDEAEFLTGDADPDRAAAALLRQGPSTIVVKLGARGAMAATVEGEKVQAEPHPVDRVVDPIGAGDAFAAGFLAALLQGDDLDAALALGNRCGAHAVTARGDIEALPYWDEIEAEASGDPQARR